MGASDGDVVGLVIRVDEPGSIERVGLPIPPVGEIEGDPVAMFSE